MLSEGNTPDEITQTLREYFESGTRLAWVVDWKTRSVAVYHHAGEPVRVLDVAGQLDGEQVVRGFAMPVVELFRNVPAAE